MMKKLFVYSLLILVSTQVWNNVSAAVLTTGNPIETSTPAWDAKIYPNPNNGIFTIMIIDNSAVIDVTVFNVIGEKVFEMTALGDHGARIDLGHLQKGLYIVQLLDEKRGEMITRRMQVK